MKDTSENILIMKILSNPHRLKILGVLFGGKKDWCVNEISKIVGISQSLASHQLSYLSVRGVIEGHRVGQTMCYMPVNNKTSNKIQSILKILI